ncbi:MAG: hypothetical protein JRI68_06490 [Deltaproteobacteria bacterium]|nr:hypothetical protein [Deltaproteobacteria bacterium]
MPNQNQESSVMFSLEELTKLEEERIEQEAQDRAATAAKLAREQREAGERAQAVEAARIAEQAAERERETQREAEEAARLAGLAQAEIEQARLDREARAALEVREAQLRHERELVKLRYGRSHEWYRLAVVVGMVAILGVGGLIGVQAMADPGPSDAAAEAHVRKLEEDRQRLLSSRRTDLERTFRVQRDQLERLTPLSDELDQARSRALDAHLDVARHGVDETRLIAFADAVLALSDALEQHHRARQLSELDQVHAKLKATMGKVSRPGPAITRAAERAVTTRQALEADQPDAQMLATFDKALTTLALELAGPSPVSVDPAVTTGGGEESCQDPHDPLCGRLPGGR